MLNITQAKMAEPAENYNLLEKQSMKNFLVILLLLLQTGFAWARPKVADAGPEAALQSFIQAFDNLDWDRFRSFFADDATVFYPRGFPRRAQGRAEIEANFQQVFAQIRGDRTQPPYMDLRPTDLYLQRFGDMAIATFHLDDKPGFLNRRTIVLHKMTDGWKIVHLHASEVTTAAKPASAQELIKAYPATNWTVLDNPEDAGWSSSKLQLARQYADSIQSAAVMIVQGGVVVDQWGDTAKKFNSYSIRKSLLSALYGIYLNEKKIDITQALEQLGIDDNPPSLTHDEKQARVIDLLRARSGVYHTALLEPPYMKATRPQRGSHAPGTFWYYNNWDFNTLGTIFEQGSKLSIGKAFEQRIASPLQMEDFRAEDVYYVRGPESIYPAYPCHISSRDLARFGLLYLRRGRWGNQQIVPESWVEKLSQPTEALGQYNGYDIGGYEYLWWTEVNGKHFPGVDLGGGSFSARGIGGHFVVVIPARNLVIVHRVDNGDDQHQVVTWPQFGHLLKLILDAQTRYCATGASDCKMGQEP